MRSTQSTNKPGQPSTFDQGSISDQSRALASRLSGHMGLEGALQVSEENQWDGVVAALREIQRKQARR